MGRSTRRYKRIRRSSSARRSRSRRGVVRKRPSRVTGRGRGYLRVGGAYRTKNQLRVEKKSNAYSSLNANEAATNTHITITGIPATSGVVSGAEIASSHRWPMQPFTGIVQDSTSSGRVGRQIQIKSIHFSGAVRWAALTIPLVDGVTTPQLITANPSFTGNVHLITVLDKQCNGAIPAPSDIWNIPASVANSSSPGDANALIAGLYSEAMVRNLDNSMRFRILDHTIVRRPAAYNQTGPLPIASGLMLATAGVAGFDVNIPCNLLVEYSGADGYTANIKSNNVYLFAWAESPLGMNPAGDHCWMTLTKRVRYYDV